MASKKSKKSSRGGRSRRPVTLERVVEAAMAIADAEGIDALTMRSVATALGVQAMSLYNHVESKDAILDRMVDAVFTLVAVRTDLPWKESLRERARGMREVLRLHPWAIGLLESRRSPGAASLAHHDAWIGVMRTAGFPVTLVAHALAAVDSYLYGFALQEVSLPIGPKDDVPGLAREILASMPADALPHLTWLTAEHVLKPGYSFGDEFEYGLGLVLDGLERSAEALGVDAARAAHPRVRKDRV